MNPRGRFKWSFFLVASLLLAIVSLAAAQDATPPAPKAAPVVTELGESASPVANLNESEPNNGFNNADVMQLGDVMSGNIGGPNDQDFFKIDVPDGIMVLIDVDAASLGSALDPVICIYDSYQTEQKCVDDVDGLDPMIFMDFCGPGCSPGTPYYIRVRDYNYPNEGGAAYTYKLMIFPPLLVSAATGGKVAGISFTNADVLAHYDFADGTEKWMMFFDASDVGITKNVVALGTHDTYDFEIVLAANQMVNIEGTQQMATPFDVLRFDGWRPGHQIGPQTTGDFYFEYRGGNYGLSAASEKIDALTYSYFASTTGAATYNSGNAARDEDIFNLPYGYPAFVGANVPGLASEDVIAADWGWNPAGGFTEYYLTILGSGRVDGYRVTQKDIFTVNGNTNRVIGLYWNGPAHHFNYNIDAIDAGE